jgi:Co/Zn/Cd efflux system component
MAEQLLETLVKAWNEPDAMQRDILLAQSVSEAVRYTDQHRPEPVSSRQEMQEFLTLFRERVEHQLEITKLESHHHVFRLHWQLKRERDGHVLSSGQFVGEIQNDRITNIISFIDKMGA